MMRWSKAHIDRGIASLGYNDLRPLALTDEQRQQIKPDAQQPTEMVDPATRRRYVLMPVEDYEALKDERDQSNLRTAAGRTLGRRLAEGE